MHSNVCNKYRKLKKKQNTIYLKKTLNLSIEYSKCVHEYEKMFKEEQSLETLKFSSLINNIEQHQKIHNHT